MAFVLADRVRDTTTTTGTGTVTLSGTAPTGYQTFGDGIGNGNNTYYTINADTQWEVGIGTYTASGTTLSRNTVLASSSGGALVDFAIGIKNVFVDYPAEKAVTDIYGTALAATTATNLASGAAGSIPYQTAANTTAMLATGTGVLIGGTTPSYTMSPSLTQVTVAGDPTVNLQVATKQYVDTIAASGVTYHTPVKYEVPVTTGNLNALYNQPGGAGDGVGATLTNNGTKAAFAPDGPTASVGDRILVYNQTSAFQNGVYTVTTVGTPDPGGTNWVLTRATDADTYGLKDPDALGQGDAFFVTSGNTGAGETYVCNTLGTITFGSTAITFAQVSSAQVYSAGTGLTLTNTVFSLTAPVATTLGGTGLTSFTSGGAVYATSSSTLTTGTLPATAGGTGQSSYTTGDLLYASSSTALSVLADVATGNALISGGVGTAPSWGKIGLTTHVSGTLPVANGGSGATTLTGYLVGNGTSAFTATATIPTSALSGTISLTTQVSGTLGAGNGGTGLSSYTVGDILYASGTTTLSSLADVATGNALISGGVSNAPSWGKIGLTTHVSGTLPVSNGGSGATTLTGYLKGNGTSAFTASATIPAGDITGAALTKADDTNVTLTLGGSPSTALLAATSITAGWTGQLAVSRGGTGNSTLASGYLLKGNGVSPTSASVVYDDGTNAGVGTTSLGAKWDVKSQINVTSPSNVSMNAVRASNFGYSTGYSALIVGSTSGNNTPCINVDPIANPSGSFSGLGDEVMFRNGAYFISPNSANTAYNQYLRLIDGYVQFTNSARAPIFYDSDNTAYYMDLTSSTSLNAAGSLVASGNITLNNGANRYVRIGSATNYSYDLQTTGDDFQIIEAGTTPRLTIKYPSGNVGIGTVTPLAKLHVAASTPTGIGALPSGVTGILDSSGNNYLLFRHSADNATYSGIAFQDNNMGGYVVFGNYGANPSDQLAIAGYNGGILQYGTSDTINPALRTTVASWNSTGLQINNGDMRAPIYYDSNDTGYYLDAASTSRINQINYTGLYYASNTAYGVIGANGFFDTVNSGVDADALELCYVYGSEVRIGTGGGNKAIRASIFYEGTNTAYYVDPNGSTSLRTTGDWRSDSSAWTGEFSGKIQYHANNWYFQSANQWEFRRSDSATAFYVTQAGVAVALGDMRAPIFYDNNNTGYYVDPASTSRMNNLSLDTIAITSGITGLTSAPITTQYYNIGTTPTWMPMTYQRAVYTSGYITHLNTGLYKNANGWGVGATGWYAAIGGSDSSPTQAWYLTYDAYIQNSLGYVSTSGSFRAPIFYDENNTAYYMDPASDTRLGGLLSISGGRPLTYSASNGSLTIQGDAGGWATGTYFLGSSGTTLGGFGGLGSGNSFSYLWAGNAYNNAALYLYPSNYAESPGSLRAPIFYDSNNTGYYFDGSATSRWTTSNQDGFHSFNNYGLGIVGLYASTRFQCVYAMGDAYKGNADGTSLSGAYGLWWSYPSAGGPAATLSSHGLMCIVNGSNVAQLDASTRATGDMRAPIFYDNNDTGYYLDPNSTSEAALRQRGGALIGPNTSYGAYLRVGTSGWLGDYSSVFVTNGNLHLDAQPGYNLYLAWYNTSTINVGGSITANGNITAYSDIRVKDNVETIPNALDKLDQIRGVTYTRTDRDDKERRYAGVIAQEIEQVLPEAIFESEEYKSVDYNATIGLLIQAVKELRDEVEALRK